MAESEQSGSNEFLLAEFNALNERAIHLEDLKASRVNFLLIIFAATIAILPGIFEKFPNMALQATFAIALVVFVVGITSLNQVVFYSTSIVDFYRRASRIRRWYVERNPEMTPYVAFVPRDDYPGMHLTGTWMYLRGADGVLLALNSVAVATGIASLFLLLAPSAQPMTRLWISLPAVVIAWLAQWYWIRALLTKEEERQEKEVHFGKSKSEQVKQRYRGEEPGNER